MGEAFVGYMRTQPNGSPEQDPPNKALKIKLTVTTSTYICHNIAAQCVIYSRRNISKL